MSKELEEVFSDWKRSKAERIEQEDNIRNVAIDIWDLWNDSISVDLDAEVSEGKDGAWVQAWVWVDYCDMTGE